MKTKTATEKEYWNQRKRIQNQIRRARKEGFEIGKRKDGSLLINLPPVPNTITDASIRRLKRMDRDWINLRMKKESKWIDFKEVKKKEAKRELSIKRSIAAKKRYEKNMREAAYKQTLSIDDEDERKEIQRKIEEELSIEEIKEIVYRRRISDEELPILRYDEEFPRDGVVIIELHEKGSSSFYLNNVDNRDFTQIQIRNVMFDGETIKANDVLSRISTYAKLNNEREGWTHTNFPDYIPEGKEWKYNTMMHQFYEYKIKK